MLMGWRQRSEKDGNVRYVVRWHRSMLVGGFGVMAAIGSTFLPSTEGRWGPVVFVAVLISAPALLAVRSLWSSAIEFREEEIVVYEFLRTRRIPLSKVRDAVVVESESLKPMFTWRVPGFQLDDVTEVAEEIPCRRTPAVVDDIVEEARRRIAENRPDAVA